MAGPLEKERHTAELAAQRAVILTKRVLSSVDKGEISKTDDSPVSIADFGAQALIVSAIRSSFPNDMIIGEEDASSLREDPNLMKKVWELVSTTHLDDEESEKLLGRPDTVEAMCDMIDVGGSTNTSDSGRVWVIDPVDGTKTFLNGTQYAVVISLVIDGVDQLGVIACPKLDPENRKFSDTDWSMDGPGHIVSAVRGYGAHIRPISQGSLLPAKGIEKRAGKLDMKNLIFAENIANASPRFPNRDKFATRLGAPWPPVHIYSSQVTYVTLALGLVDYQVRAPVPTAKPSYIWDHAGGIAIFEECGGKVTDLNGKRIDLSKGRTLSENYGNIGASQGIHDKVLAMVREELAEFPEYASR